MELNRHKIEKIVRLVSSITKPAVGIVAGITNGIIKSPFSAPFGGIHYRNDVTYVSEIDLFFDSLKEYIRDCGLRGIELTLPPDLYHQTINAKTISSMLRQGFTMSMPEISNWVDLRNFNGEFRQKNSREYYRQAIRNGLTFSVTSDYNEKQEIYELIRLNRQKFGRNIYMTLSDLLETSKLWPVDFFKVQSQSGRIVASAIFYRFRDDISYAVFWGDNEDGRTLRAMDFLASKLWSYYKELGFNFIDLGISTENGAPNEGLLRFKESHDAISSLRHNFSWYN